MRSWSFIVSFALAAAAFAGPALAWGPANHARITDAAADQLGYTIVTHHHLLFLHWDTTDRTLTDVMKSGGVLADLNKTLVRHDAAGWFTTATGHRIADATKALLDGADQDQPWADTVRKVALTQFKTSRPDYVFAQGWVSHYLADDVEHHHYPGSRSLVKTLFGHDILKLTIAESFAADTTGGKMPSTLAISHAVWHAVLAEMAARTGNQELTLIEDADLDRAVADFKTTYITELFRYAWVVRTFSYVGTLPFDHAEYDGLFARSVTEQLTNVRGEGLLDARGAGPLPTFK